MSGFRIWFKNILKYFICNKDFKIVVEIFIELKTFQRYIEENQKSLTAKETNSESFICYNIFEFLYYLSLLNM